MSMTVELNSQSAINELYKAFKLFNDHFFGGELPEAYIIITSTLKQNAYGWFTPAKVWQDHDGTVQKHEIAMSAEWMNRDWVDVMRTLLHEMIHLYCHTNNIQDTSRQNRYHNKHFKAASEAHGFYYDTDKPDPKLGWTFSKLTPETVELVKGWDINPDAFKLARKAFGVADKGGNGGRTKKPTFKHVCPGCGSTFRAPAELNVKCNDCDQDFEVEA